MTLDSATLATIASGFAIAGSLALLVRAILLQRGGGSVSGVRSAMAKGDVIAAGRLATSLLASGAEPASEAYLSFVAGRAAMAKGDHGGAIVMLSRSCAALTVAPPETRRSGHAVPYDFDLYFDAHLFLGLALLQRGQLVAADTALRAALDVRTAGRDLDRATAMRHLAVVRRARNLLPDARTLAEDALATGVAQGDALSQALSLRTLAQIDDAGGAWASAAAGLADALDHFRTARRHGHDVTGVRADETVTRAMLARAEAEAGRLDDADETLHDAARLPPRAPADLAVHVAYFASTVHRLAGRPTEAHEAATRAAAGYRAAQMLLMEQHAHRQAGLALAALGRREEACSTLRAAADALDSFGAAHEAELTRHDLAVLDGG